MEIIKNNKGGQKLAFQGFLYTKKRTLKSQIYWECSSRGSLSCNGKASTDCEMTTCRVMIVHSHPPDDTAVEAAKVRTLVKERASASRAKPAQLLGDLLADVPVDVRVALGKKETVKRNIRNNQMYNFPKDPKSIKECIFEGDWCLISGPEKEQFIIHDSGEDSSNRVLVFASKDSLEHLSNSKTWFMDGTFETAPSIFEQIYVIRAPIGDSAVTRVYALLTNKQQRSYEELFNSVICQSEEYGFSQDPLVIVSDFEQAVFSAIHTTFGEHVKTQGCFYHLTQSTWRKTQELGLRELYRSDNDIKHRCGIIDALAFLPLEDVISGMGWIKENAPDILGDLVSYFDSTYVSGGYRTVRSTNETESGVPSVRFRKLPTLFHPKVWNVHEATINSEPRTNNICEGWNNSFKQLIGHSHPSVWKVILAFQQDNANARDKLNWRTPSKKD